MRPLHAYDALINCSLLLIQRAIGMTWQSPIGDGGCVWRAMTIKLQCQWWEHYPCHLMLHLDHPVLHAELDLQLRACLENLKA